MCLLNCTSFAFELEIHKNPISPSSINQQETSWLGEDRFVKIILECTKDSKTNPIPTIALLILYCRYAKIPSLPYFTLRHYSMSLSFENR